MSRLFGLVISLFILSCITVSKAETSANPIKVDEKYVQELKLRAEADDVNAQNELGLLYAKGEVIPKDSLEAMTWFLIADSNKQKNITLDTKMQAEREKFVSFKDIYPAMVKSAKWRIAKASGGSIEDTNKFTETLNKSFLSADDAELKKRFLDLEWGYERSHLKIDRHLTPCDTSMQYLTKSYGFMLPYYRVMWCADTTGKISWIEGHVEKNNP